MDRGYLGTAALPTERDDETYLDFVEGLRGFNGSKVGPVMRQRASEQQAATPLDAVQQLRSRPIVASRNRLHRTSQEMMWQGVIESYQKRRHELLAWLDESDRRGPGIVQYDPNFAYPDYFSSVDYHLQPGGYHADPLAGFVYHYGTKVFYAGKNNNDDVQRDLVMGAPAPSDGQVQRVLDLACSIGQSTTAWKERYPGAEVWGIDAGAPMVRYAHLRAADLGLDVNFKQALAEDTRFPDHHFDIAYAYILFHEVPWRITEQIVREAFRVLRPGGLFIVVDARNIAPGADTAVQHIIWSHETSDNGEPYLAEFVYGDFGSLLRQTFRTVTDDYLPGASLPMRVAAK